RWSVVSCHSWHRVPDSCRVRHQPASVRVVGEQRIRAHLRGKQDERDWGSGVSGDACHLVQNVSLGRACYRSWRNIAISLIHTLAVVVYKRLTSPAVSEKSQPSG